MINNETGSIARMNETGDSIRFESRLELHSQSEKILRVCRIQKITDCRVVKFALTQLPVSCYEDRHAGAITLFQFYIAIYLYQMTIILLSL